MTMGEEPSSRRSAAPADDTQARSLFNSPGQVYSGKQPEQPKYRLFDTPAHMKTKATSEAADKSASAVKGNKNEKAATPSKSYWEEECERYHASERERNKKNPFAAFPKPHREVLGAQKFLDLQHQVLTLKERVLELEGISDARREFDRNGAGNYKIVLQRIDLLEKIVLEIWENIKGAGEAKSSDKAAESDKGAQHEQVSASTIHNKTAGLQKDDRIERLEHESKATDEWVASSDIPGLRLRYQDPELEDLKKKCANLQEHLRRAWPPKTAKAPPVNTQATTTYGGVLLHPIIRENPNFPAPTALTPAEPTFDEHYEIPQPGTITTFGGPRSGVPSGPRGSFRRRYGGGFPMGYGQDRDDTPRPIFPQGIIWNANEPAIHAPNLPPSQASHFRQPTVTEEAKENFVDAVEDLPTSRLPLANDSPDAFLTCLRDREPRLRRLGNPLDLEQIPVFGRRRAQNRLSGFRVGGMGYGSITYDPSLRFGNRDPFADRRTREESGNTDLGETADDFSSGDVFAGGALQPGEDNGGGQAEQSAISGHRGSMHRRPFTLGTMNMKGEGPNDEVGAELAFFD